MAVAAIALLAEWRGGFLVKIYLPRNGLVGMKLCELVGFSNISTSVVTASRWNSPCESGSPIEIDAECIRRPGACWCCRNL
jgi:hypothetical protein